jgi:hypothetical protein
MPYRLSDLKRTARNGQPTTFLTLTVNPARGQSPEGRARELVEAMRTMFKRAGRKFRKQKLEYLAVFEETKKGEPHLHVLMRAPFIPQRWISEQMDELIAAPIVDIRRVTNANLAARYVAKYVAKGPKSFGSLKRYWSTPGYDLDKPTKEQRAQQKAQHWWVIDTPLWLLAEQWATFGRVVLWINDNEIIAPSDGASVVRAGPGSGA